MYNPKKVFTPEGYTNYLAHIQNMENALEYIMNHADDLHLGMKDARQYDKLHDMYGCFFDLKDALLHGDGERYMTGLTEANKKELKQLKKKFAGKKVKTGGEWVNL